MRWFSAGFQESEPIIYGQQKISLRSLAISLVFPWPNGSAAWTYTRPISVRLEQEGIPPKSLTVVNYTRLALLGILIYFAIITKLIWRLSNGR
jgi:hypothetical protein